MAFPDWKWQGGLKSWHRRTLWHSNYLDKFSPPLIGVTNPGRSKITTKKWLFMPNHAGNPSRYIINVYEKCWHLLKDQGRCPSPSRPWWRSSTSVSLQGIGWIEPLDQSSPTFLALQIGGRVGGEGMVPHKQPASAHRQLHLYEQHAGAPIAYSNGVRMHVLACCLHKWGCAHTLTHFHCPVANTSQPTSRLQSRGWGHLI